MGSLACCALAGRSSVPLDPIHMLPLRAGTKRAAVMPEVGAAPLGHMLNRHPAQSLVASAAVHSTAGPCSVCNHSAYPPPIAIFPCCRLDCGQGLLLDCGEGCLGQMQRLYGHKGAMRQVAALGCVWVSHRHAGKRGAYMWQGGWLLGLHACLLQMSKR